MTLTKASLDAALEPPPVRSTNASDDGKVVEFSGPTTVPRTQDMIVEMVLMGISEVQIATAVGWNEDQVRKFMASDVFYRAISSRGQSLSLESLRNLLKVCSFMAVARMPALIQSKNEQVALRACQMCLDNTIAPAKLLDLDRKPSVGSPDDVRAEVEATQKRVEYLRKQAG